jgi:hypothetical protein
MNLLKTAESLTLPQKGYMLSVPSVPTEEGVIEVRKLVLRLVSSAASPGGIIVW